MFENKKVFIPKIGEEVHYSRIIASWYNEASRDRYQFIDWLTYLGIAKNDIDEIAEMYDCGKLELESSVKNFIKFKNCNHIW